MTMASEDIASAVADSRLLQSFIVCPSPALLPHPKHFADGGQQLLTALDRRGISCHHDGKRAIDCTGHAAADGRINELHPLLGETRRHLGCHPRTRGRQIDHDLDAGAAADAIRTDPPPSRTISGLGRLMNTTSALEATAAGLSTEHRALCCESSFRPRPRIKYGQALALAEQAMGNRAAHLAQADEADLIDHSPAPPYGFAVID